MKPEKKMNIIWMRRVKKKRMMSNQRRRDALNVKTVVKDGS